MIIQVWAIVHFQSVHLRIFSILAYSGIATSLTGSRSGIPSWPVSMLLGIGQYLSAVSKRADLFEAVVHVTAMAVSSVRVQTDAHSAGQFM